MNVDNNLTSGTLPGLGKLTVKIRGKHYTAENLLDTHLTALILPLKKRLEASGMLGDVRSALAVEEIAIAMLDPAIKPRLCEAVCAIFPNLPPEIAKYDLFRLQDGREKVEFALNLNSTELRDLILGLGECLRSVQLPQGAKTQAEGNGFALDTQQTKKRKRRRRRSPAVTSSS